MLHRRSGVAAYGSRQHSPTRFDFGPKPPSSLTSRVMWVFSKRMTQIQATAWQKRRRPVGVLVSRNRVLCALEGAELSLLR